MVITSRPLYVKVRYLDSVQDTQITNLNESVVDTNFVGWYTLYITHFWQPVGRGGGLGLGLCCPPQEWSGYGQDLKFENLNKNIGVFCSCDHWPGNIIFPAILSAIFRC
jgi:hypothetical protein